ncbi:hypothetical protein MTR67_032560 [Solanum verrucosum]|uniref:F-box domain-containing protein n=1 Tax=Solanum verrucosum TaxID=315347 RepID=A0AAF0U4G4_SOLVR|nr:hypothetical protein MTR67_032560 [Solanum verrucosum]
MPKRRRYNGRRKQQKNSMDKISNLPIEIIHQIHSCLPRIDAVKTSILSKKWQSIWASHLRILLDEIDFGADYSRYTVTDKPKRDAFLTYLIKSLESRERPSEYNCDVDKLFLRMTVENSSVELLDHDFKNVIAGCPQIEQLHIQETEKLCTIVVSNPNMDFFGVQLLCSDDPFKLCDYWYSWFRDILESCALSKRLSLICDIEEVVLIPVEVTYILPVNDIKNLELEIISRHGTFQEVIDYFTWILPDLKTLSLTLGSTTKFFEVGSVFPMFFITVSVIVLDELHIYYIANAVLVERNDVKVLLAEVIHNPKSDQRVSWVEDQVNVRVRDHVSNRGGGQASSGSLNLNLLRLKMPKRRRYHGRKKPPKQPKNSVDRISNLPIEIIREIHSRLPWKYAVKTSILSKKWQSIWTSHPRILLDEIDFGVDYSEYSVTDKAKRDAFLTYLIKSLEIRERPSEYNCAVENLLLRMTVENSSAELLVNKWISVKYSILGLC